MILDQLQQSSQPSKSQTPYPETPKLNTKNFKKSSRMMPNKNFTAKEKIPSNQKQENQTPLLFRSEKTQETQSRTVNTENSQR